MKRLYLLLLLLVLAVTTYGQAYDPYTTEGWDAPYAFTGDSLASPSWTNSYGYYGLGIMTLNSNPGGWLNYNYWRIDSLMQSLVVYTDTNQFLIRNDTLQLSNDVAYRLDSLYSSAYIDLEPTSSLANKEGRVFYDSVRKALSYYTEESDVTLNVGRELWIRVYNNTASDITNGMPVYPTGAVAGGWGTVAPAQADSDATSNVIGLATHTIEPSTFGYVTRFGDIGDVNTVGLQIGGTFYLSSSVAGDITTDKPTAPANAVPLGGVTSIGEFDGTLFALVERFNDINGVAQIGFDGDSEAQGITTIDVPVRITNGSNTLYIYNTSVGHDISLSGDTIFVAEDGVYEFILNHSFQGVSSAIFRFQLKDGDNWILNASGYRKTTTADVGSCGFSAKRLMSAGDYVTMWVTNLGNGGDCTMVGSTVSIRQER